MWLILGSTARAQFSPGELSRAHQDLEGLSNCSQCHEIGNEIRGTKCLECHQEIKRIISEKHGYHAANSAHNCVECHKEHLGRDAQTIRFNKDVFEHAETGYLLKDRHAFVKCEKCHAKKNIKAEDVLNILEKADKQTYLGLATNCISCHEDVHKGTMKGECQSCHTMKGWSPAANFDHAKTRFALSGKHADVECSKCHTAMKTTAKDATRFLYTQTFEDCTPCHTSPHTPNFSTKTCNSCHVTTGWRGTDLAKKFDHNITRFKLTGLHATVRCEKCHPPSKKSLKMPFDKCTDCHEDFHRGEFVEEYSNDCTKCHTTGGFKPSTFDFVRHNKTDFPLAGSHLATVCAKCHTNAETNRLVFRFVKTRCETCHKDVHRGQFVSYMKKKNCEVCHSVDAWGVSTYDHSATSFPLKGKHTTAKCTDCHKSEKTRDLVAVAFKNTKKDCQECHKDEAHEGQLAVKGVTQCTKCHSPEGWKLTSFQHDLQSSFAIDGAHKDVKCNECHRPEKIKSNKFLIRYKPMSAKCESCHQKKELRNG